VRLKAIIYQRAGASNIIIFIIYVPVCALHREKSDLKYEEKSVERKLFGNTLRRENFLGWKMAESNISEKQR
jgi:hypothetical protein